MDTLKHFVNDASNSAINVVSGQKPSQSDLINLTIIGIIITVCWDLFFDKK